MFDPRIDIIPPFHNHILPPIYDKTQISRIHCSSIAMVRSSSLTHTLSGFIYEANAKSHTIITTHDLSPFLCSISESTRHPTDTAKQESTDFDGVNHGISPILSISEESSRSSQPNKSCLVSFLSPPHFQSQECNITSEEFYCILRINGCKITLEKPYQGPPVVNGVPKIVIRTNLVPSSAALLKKDIVPPVVSSISLISHPTIVRTHPQLPYLFVGHVDDSICIITPESHCN